MKLKKILAVLLAVAMLGAMSAAVFAEEDAVVTTAAAPAFTLRVEGVKSNLYYGTVELVEGESVLKALCRVLDAQGISYDVQGSDYGEFLNAVGEDVSAQFGGWDGWLYYVNGVDVAVGIDTYVPAAGDSVLVCYADPYGDPATLLPTVTATRARTGEVTLNASAQTAVYAEDWSVSYVSVPAADVKVFVDGAEYVTDENGNAVLSAEDSAKESISVQIEKFAENGKPLVVRLAPDFAIDLTAVTAPAFSDVEEGKWYTEPVNAAAAAGLVNGFTDGTFRPAALITRAEVAAILYRMAGSPEVEAKAVFNDVAADNWAAKAVTWCAENGIVNGSAGSFMPTQTVTRQDLATMLVRLNTNVLHKELPADAEAPAFADNDQIAAYAAEAVYLLQKAGIVNGTDGNFNPRSGASRAEVCKMAMGLMG